MEFSKEEKEILLSAINANIWTIEGSIETRFQNLFESKHSRAKKDLTGKGLIVENYMCGLGNQITQLITLTNIRNKLLNDMRGN